MSGENREFLNIIQSMIPFIGLEGYRRKHTSGEWSEIKIDDL